MMKNVAKAWVAKERAWDAYYAAEKAAKKARMDAETAWDNWIEAWKLVEAKASKSSAAAQVIVAKKEKERP